MSTTCVFPSALSSQSSSLAVPSGSSALLERQRNSELRFCAVSGPACSQVHFRIMSSSPVRNGYAHEASSCVCWKAGTEDTAHGLRHRDWAPPSQRDAGLGKDHGAGDRTDQVRALQSLHFAGRTDNTQTRI